MTWARFAILLVALSWLPQGSAYMRLDEPDRPYLFGYLTWDGSKYGIAWDSEAPTTQGPFPAPPPSRPKNCGGGLTGVVQNESCTNAFMQGLAYDLAPPPPPPPKLDAVVIWSDPVPFRLYVNASRAIWFDAVAKLCENFPDMEIRITVGDALMGWPANTILAAHPKAKNTFTAPAGWCAHSYRLQSAVTVVPEGTRIELAIKPTSKEFPGIGTAGANRSRIALPLYHPEEVLQRRPGQTTADPSLGPGAVVASAALLLGRPRRGKLAILATLLLSSALAGCAGPGEGPKTIVDPGAEIRVTHVPEAGATFANLSGIVRNEDGAPIPSALVRLTDRGLMRLTGRFGDFTVSNLTGRETILRVERAGYTVLQTPVPLKAGLNTIEITLAYDSTTPLAQGHRHPGEWGGKTSVLVADATLPDLRTTQVVTMDPRGPGGVKGLVYPGTERVEVAVSWEAAAASVRFGKLGMTFASRHQPENITPLLPAPNGGAFQVATNWEMTDVGHAEYSLWAFWFSGIAGGTQAEDSKPFGPVRVRVTVHRGGAQPVEPAHPDRWQGLDRHDVVFHSTMGPPKSASSETSVLLAGPGVVDFVPPETKRLEVVLTYSRDPRFPAFPYSWTVKMKDGGSPFHSCGPVPPQDGVISLGEGDALPDRRLKWTVDFASYTPAPVHDPPYVATGNWCFWISPTNQENHFIDDCVSNSCLDTKYVNPGHPRYPIFLYVHVVAHRDAAPAT